MWMSGQTNRRAWPGSGQGSGRLIALALGGLMMLSGCQQDLVYQRSMADLNQKAQAMMQAGDYAGAVSRLEAAHDLQPEEPNTMYNLAIAYQMNGNYDKAAALFHRLLDKKSMDSADIHKALGIIYEAMADKHFMDARMLEEETAPAGPDTVESSESAPDDRAAQAALLKQEAEASYQLALQHYQKALDAQVKNPAEVETQMRALEARLQQGREM